MLQLNIPRTKPQKVETDNLERNGLINRNRKKDEEHKNKKEEKDSFRLRMEVIVQIVKDIDVKMVFINIINVLAIVYY